MSPNHPHDVPSLISQHGVIGDMRTLALVAEDGTIDFFCHPEIGSPTLFAALLDPDKGGLFRLGVSGGPDAMKHRQIYLPDTNILITRFLGADGIGEISDFMPVDGSGRIIRRAKAIMGAVDFELTVSPKPDYGRSETTVEVIDGGFAVRSGSGNDDVVYFYTTMAVEIDGGTVRARQTLKEDETLHVVFCPGRKEQPTVDTHYVRKSFSRTRDYWHKWVNAGSYPTFWRDLVVRSALTLKLLTSAEHGSIAAAATFALPEVIGGERNWDYRYCWVRDAAFSLYSLSRLGYYDEAESFIHFLMERAVEGDEPGLQIMYGMDGKEKLPETNLDHLAGYAGSQPVRIGNAAYAQRQMDIYGEFMDAVYIATKARGKPAYSVWIKIARIMDWLCSNWHLPDRGIWESRGEPKEYLSSRLMSWVALDRGLRIAQQQSLPADVDRWRTERDRIQKSLLEEFWNSDVGAFTQYKGGKTLDAVVLLMPLVKFINPRDQMWTSTLKAVKENPRPRLPGQALHQYGGQR